jgi:hypothetical protein
VKTLTLPLRKLVYRVLVLAIIGRRRGLRDDDQVHAILNKRTARYPQQEDSTSCLLRRRVVTAALLLCQRQLLLLHR